MASTINFSGNTYSGEVLKDALVYASHENETAKQGLIHIVPGIQHKLVLPHITLGKIIQDNKPTPTSTEGGNSSGDNNQFNHSERYLEPKDFMVYLEFNPRDYEKYWREFQPTGPLNFRELAPEVQAIMLRAILDKTEGYIGDSIWMSKKGGVSGDITAPSGSTNLGGEASAGLMKYFDGALMRVLTNTHSSADTNEKASGKVVIAGNTDLTTGEQVAAALLAMWKACPNTLRTNKKMKFVMNWNTWNLYNEYLTNQQFKYADASKPNTPMYQQIPIKTVVSAPDHTIFLGKFSNDNDSCLWMGVDYATDQESINVDKVAANSEMWFMQMRMKVDVNIVKPSEIVVWTSYKKS